MIEKSLLLSNPITNPIKVLILDVQMPEKNGLEVVKEVKDLYKQIREINCDRFVSQLFVEEPVYVFLSSHVCNVDFVTQAKSLGVKHYYEKPVSFDEL